METAASRSDLTPGLRHPARAGGAPLRDADIVLQVDGAVSSVNGISWLTARRDAVTARRMEAIHREAAEQGWSHEELTRASLACLRPRRAEVIALGAAYLAALTPGVIEAAHRMRRAGASVELSGDVAVEAMLGVAGALGVTPDAIHAPRLRFDALGAYTGCDLGLRETSVAPGQGPAAPRPRRVHVGPGTAERMAVGADRFVRFTGVVAHEGPGGGEQIASFADLAELVAG